MFGKNNPFIRTRRFKNAFYLNKRDKIYSNQGWHVCFKPFSTAVKNVLTNNEKKHCFFHVAMPRAKEKILNVKSSDKA